MVSVVHALSDSGVDAATLTRLAAGLPEPAREKLERALDVAAALYADKTLGTGEDVLRHGVGMALQLAGLNLDIDTRLAAILYASGDFLPEAREKLTEQFGAPAAALVENLHRLKGLRPLTEATSGQKLGPAVSGTELKAQAEILRKMLLAMADDIRVVLLRLTSRTQTLRWFTDQDVDKRRDVARESLELYAPLANRLGVWQLKWEIEDLSFRFLEPATYKTIAKQLDEKRGEREDFIADMIARLQAEMRAAGITAEVYGRPKHIFSIWNKMRAKDLDFEKVYDVRALRIIVPEIRDCYTALGIIHALWQPIHGEFDDYISHPKGNNYRSLHTAVIADDGRSVEVQVRTREMHQHAELGVAAHWRYKEAGAPARAESAYDEKIAWLRQLLSWRDEITDSSSWVEHFKRAALDDTIYVLTPQGRVVDLPKGSTPIDFAYRLHTDLGHRCRGAKVDGHLVPLNTALANGQRVEINTIKTGGPSRDWLAPGYLQSPSARRKVKAWFVAQQEQDQLAQGKSLVAKELQREGQTRANLEDLAHKLGCKGVDAFYLAMAKGELGPRAIQVALGGATVAMEPVDEVSTVTMRRSKAGDSRILVVGMDKLLTQLGRCCKPVPPDPVGGFVTRGKGVSVHRLDCSNFCHMAARNPERVIEAQWGNRTESLFATDLLITANDRQGLLRDISDVLSKERINVTAVNTLTKSDIARMAFTVELADASQMTKLLDLVAAVRGVISVRRRG